jgi:hypothetical protein
MYASLIVAVIGGAAALDANTFRGSAQTFPRNIAIVVCGLGFLSFLVELRKALVLAGAPRPEPPEPVSAVPDVAPAAAEMAPGDPEFEEEFRFGRAMYYFAWVIGYIGVIYLAGFLVGTVVFLAAYFLFQERTSKRFAVIAVASTAICLVGLDRLVDFGWPEGLLGW